MPRTIESIDIGGTDQRVIMGRAQFAALLDAGNTWNRIRIGGRAAITDWGYNIHGTVRWAIGVMSNPSDGVANGPLSGANTSHYLGFYSDDNNWSRSTAATDSYTYQGTVSHAKKVGATVTTAVNTVQTATIPFTSENIRTGLFVEISKGSPYTINSGFCASATALDLTYARFIEAMEESSFATMVSDLFLDTGIVYTNRSSAITVDEGTDGDLNAIVLGWSNPFPVMHFSELTFSIWS